MQKLIRQSYEENAREPTVKQIVKAVRAFRHDWLPRIEKLESIYRSGAADSETLYNLYKRGADKWSLTRLQFPIAQYITVMLSNYMLGRSPTYRERVGEEETGVRSVLDATERLYAKQSKLRLDKDLKVQCGKTGFAYELVYLDKESLQPKSIMLDADKTFVVFEETYEADSLYAVTFSCVDKKWRVTVYTETEVIEYETERPEKEAGYREVSRNEHHFARVPITMYRNNRDMRGDYESVAPLIEAFGDIMTDERFDIKRTVDALLVFYNTHLAGATEKEREEMRNALRQFGILELEDDPSNPQAKADVKSLSNPLNLTTTDTFVDRLWKSIFRLSGVPDPTQTEFFTSLSGVAIKMQLFLGMEPFVKNTESEFEYALKRRLKLYNHIEVIRSRQTEIDVGTVTVEFHHTAPSNDLETAQIISLLYDKSIASDTTLSAQLSFVEDAAKEVEQARAQIGSTATDELLAQLAGIGESG